ncbi:ATP-grasp domain-containing protein [Cecembia calidifontis]|jgi:carbamoyl-phosphate synthase large subunit|uniref:Carbamoyl-phosphate synthase large subunit n=1 Tax=Cecembia calidifontis TaxID=1187080 RepID=A0A4V2F6Y5_9BACT|nr:ATP-grasp domain-containing protein [Cecembia calidifontis]RZS97939.1 carbamoyl-phosphate synthase large subunit [Cecembia calidifontis]
MKKLTIGLSGLNNIDSPGPGIPVIRGIKDSKILNARIVGLAYENLEPGAYMHDLVDKTYKVPYPSDGVEPLLDRLRYIQEREHLDVLIPNFDSELFTFMKSEKVLQDMGIKTFLPTLKQFEERHKSNLPEYGKKYGVKVPYSEPITSVQDFVQHRDKFEFPVVVKGKFYDAHIAYDLDQVAMYFNKIAAKWGLPIVIQEFVKGTEVNVIALGDGKGNTIGAVPMRKTYITDKGKAWGGITLEDPAMMELTDKIISQTQWRGGMELELIRTSKDELYMIEINPRLPAWVYLAVAAGQNLPEALVRLALGEDVKPFQGYQVGKMFIRYSFDMITDLHEFEQLATKGEL